VGAAESEADGGAVVESVGDAVGESVGDELSVGEGDELSVGDGEGDELSVGDGEGDELSVGDGEGDELSVGEGDAVGDVLGEEEADGDADDDADAVGDELAGADLAGAGDLVGTGSTVLAGDVLRNSDSAGVMYAFAAGAAGRPDDSAPGVTDTWDAEAGVVCAAPACDWACGASGPGAPVRAKTAAAEAATSPPVIQADASGRDRRRWACLATMPRSGSAAGSPANGMALSAPNGMTAWPAAGGRISAAGSSAADP
jgi:hypothetical protein